MSMEWTLKLLIACMLVVSAPAFAQNSDQDKARSATQSGEALPYSKIRERVQRDHPGKVIGTELDDKNIRVRVMDKRGSVTDVTVDARTGETVDVEGGGNRPRR